MRPFLRGIAVSNGKRRKLPCFALSHLHADAMLYHYPEKAGVPIDMLIGTVLVCVCAVIMQVLKTTSQIHNCEAKDKMTNDKIIIIMNHIFDSLGII